MPRYYFKVRSSDLEHKEECCAVLQDAAAALDYACRMVRNSASADAMIRDCL